MYLHVTGEILSVTPASKLNDNPDIGMVSVNYRSNVSHVSDAEVGGGILL